MFVWCLIIVGVIVVNCCVIVVDCCWWFGLFVFEVVLIFIFGVFGCYLYVGVCLLVFLLSVLVC